MAERKQLRCNNSILDYDNAMMVVIGTDDDTGICYYEVSLPVDLGTSEPKSLASESLREAYAAPLDARAEIIQARFVPNILASWNAILASPEFEKGRGSAFLKVLGANAGIILKCTDMALAGEEFNVNEAGLQATCNLSEDKRVYVLASSFANVSVESRIPLA
ncbi:hypothetical protein [Mesorhizobium sp. WSM2239]|uniref:Uncharacterized protein n=2 Tax=unclassified Mesorhizobium TaxID=325217 RepID=A0AAU8DJE6_9HYPH